MANIFGVNRTDNKITLGTTGTTVYFGGHTASQLLGLDASKNLESIDGSSTYQPLDAVLTDIAALDVVADNEFIVGTGAGVYAHESGATARTSIGLGTTDTVTFADIITKGPWVDVRVYGAVGDGSTDDTTAIRNAIVAARLINGAIYFPYGDSGEYLITGSLVLVSDSLAPVDMVGATTSWFGQANIKIKANMNDIMIAVYGTDPTYAKCPLIKNLAFENLNTGTSNSVIRCDWSVGLRLNNVWIRTAYKAISALGNGEVISSVFRDVCIDRDSGWAEAGYDFTGGAINNINIIGGRIYYCKYALDISGGTTLNVFGTNIEFCQVVFRHQGLSSALFNAVHMENNNVILTNATTVPIDTGSNWSDNASEGIAILGSMTFKNCIGWNGASYLKSNMFVIKSQAGFSYRLIIDGCSFTGATALVTNSFEPEDVVAPPAGTQIFSKGTTGLTITKPPTDQYSNSVISYGESNARLAVQRLEVDMIVRTIGTLADGPTPSVLGGSYWRTGGTTTITDFIDDINGQEITLIAEHTVTIEDGAGKLVLNGNTDFVMAANDTLTLINRSGPWFETGRSDNT